MCPLLYLYDPLCGWCYAATPSIAPLRAARVALAYQPTGLFSDPGRMMTAVFAEYAWKNDLQIATLTGQTFTETYRRMVLQASGTAFDSSAAVLGLSAVAADDPTKEMDALRVLQEARYIAGQDIADGARVFQVLGEAGFASAATALEVPPQALLAANAARVAAGGALVRTLGAKGVPTLVLIDGSSRRLLDSQLLYGSPEALLKQFRPAAPALN